jgi:hypothetical protein
VNQTHVAYLKRFDDYLRAVGNVPRVRVFRTVQGQIDLIDFVPPAETLTALSEPAPDMPMPWVPNFRVATNTTFQSVRERRKQASGVFP